MEVAVVHHSHYWWIAPIVIVLVVAAVLAVILHPLSKRNNATLEVSVGETEKHVVTFIRNAFTGRVQIGIDGETTQSKIEWFLFRLSKRYVVPVGQSEQHVVTFVKTRKKLAPGVRKQTVVAYVDGVEVPAVDMQSA
jgi:hypothetical protein